VQQRLKLYATLSPDEGMELIDNDNVERCEYACNFDPAPHAQCLERLWCH